MNLITPEKLAAATNAPTRAARRALQSKFGPGPWLLTDTQLHAVLNELRAKNRFQFSRVDPKQARR
jgi:protoheme ferro-lyase